MKPIRRKSLIAVAVVLTATPLRAGVRVDSAPSELKEKQIVLRVAEKKYVTASPGSALDLTGAKVGSKQRFTIIDLNGGELADGDQVKIRYTPNSGGVPDTAKSTYWLESAEGVKRGRDGDVFKIKKVDARFALQTPSGKFVAATATNGALGVSDKLESALLVEFVDAASAAPAKSASE